MATDIYSAYWRMNDDAEFREWGSNISASLRRCGLGVAVDAGQIDWATATRPPSNSVAGYEIYYLDDALHGSYPIYIKLEYGRSVNTTLGQTVFITVGSGSDGAGNITGVMIPRGAVLSSGNSSSNPGPYFSYTCVAEGFCGICIAVGSASSSGGMRGGFLLSRSVDAAGGISTDGVTLYTPSGASTTTISPASFSAVDGITREGSAGDGCIVPLSVSNSLTGLDFQVFKHYTALPRVQPNAFVLTVVDDEIPKGTTFKVAHVGSLERTYLSLGANGFLSGCRNNTGTSTIYAVAMLWE